MPGYYDEITGKWVEDDSGGGSELDDTSGTGTIDYNAVVNPDGSVTYTDPDGSVYTVNQGGTYSTQWGGKTWTYDPSKDGFVDSSGKVISTGSAPSGLMDKIVSAIQKNPLAAAGAAFAATRGNTPQTGGYKGSIPSLQAIRQQVQYNDPNRRPGEGGRQYFTDVQYAKQGDQAAIDAAKAASQAQASGLQAAYTAAVPQVNPYAGKFAMPWQKGSTKVDESIPDGAKDDWLVYLPGNDEKVDTSPILDKIKQGMPSIDPEILRQLGTNSGDATKTSVGKENPYKTFIDEEMLMGRNNVTPGQKTGMDFEGPGFDYSGGVNKAATYDPRYAELAKAASASHGGGEIATMDYTPADQARDTYLRNLNPGFNANKEAGMAQMANQAAQSVRAAAHGGIMNLAKGRYLQGATDGMADKIDTSIDGKEPAKLSHGEFVIPADVVSHLGNGNSDAGAEKLYEMMARIRKARTGNPEQGKRINPDKFMPGGAVKGYDGTTGSVVTGTGTTSSGVTGTSNPSGATTSSTLSPWAGDYVTDYLGKGQALANQPYQTYTGPLTAGASDLQQQQFAGLSDLAKTGLTPTQYTGGVFDAAAAQQYMNPYLQASLDPQLKEQQRQADIARLADAGRLTKAGAYGGSRQAIMESEGRRNLLEKQTGLISQGYNTAFDKAMQQYNSDAARQLQTQQAQQAANEASANYGLKTLQELGQAGATQRGITSEGIAADKAQFEEQRDYPYKMVQYQKDLLTGLPITTQATTPNTTEIGQINQQLSGILGLYQTLAKLLPQAQTGG